MTQTPSSQVVFDYLAGERFGATPGLIAACTGLTASAVNSTLDRLESHGVAKPTGSAKDRARAMWVLTGDPLPLVAPPRSLKPKLPPGPRVPVTYRGAENLALMGAAFLARRAAGQPTDRSDERAPESAA